MGLSQNKQLNHSGTSGSRGIPQANVSGVFGMVAVRSQQPGEGGRKLSVDDEAHGLPGDEDGVIGFGGSVFQTGGDRFPDIGKGCLTGGWEEAAHGEAAHA